MTFYWRPDIFETEWARLSDLPVATEPGRGVGNLSTRHRRDRRLITPDGPPFLPSSGTPRAAPLAASPFSVEPPASSAVSAKEKTRKKEPVARAANVP